MSDKLILKNETCEIYENDMTKMLTDYCTRSTAHDLFPLENHRVVLIKEGNHKLYALCEMAEPVYACTSVESMGAHIDMLRFKLTSKTLADALEKIKVNKDD